MRITRLELTDFKTHASLSLEPSDRLTIIRGPNEAGKSAIGQAIALVLFRRADADDDDIRRAWAWGAASAPEIALEFESEGGSGRLWKRFGGVQGEAQLTLAGHASSVPDVIEAQVAQLSGIPSEAFFRATAGVGQRELGVHGGDDPVLSERLQAVVSGADRGTAEAKRRLAAAVHDYRADEPGSPGRLSSLQQQMSMLERELAAGEVALERLQADRAAWAEAHARREELEVQLRRQQADLAEAQRAQQLAETRDGTAERLERLERAVELLEEAERLQRAMPATVGLSQLRAAVARASSLQFEISELEAEVSVAAEASAPDEGPELAPPRPMRWLALASVLVVLGWLASFLLSDTGPAGVAVVAALAAGVVVTLVQAIRGAGRRRQYGLAMQLAETAVAQRSETDRGQQEQLRRCQRELASTLAAVGVADVEAAEQLLAASQQLTESLAHIEGELRGLGIEERNLRRLHEARDEAAVAAERAERALAALGSLAHEPGAALAAVERQLAETLPARDASRSAEEQAQGRVDANQVDAELVAGLAERLADARERYDELERRVVVHEGTLQAIEAAERATLRTAARYLEERVGPTIAAITDGRYDDIVVDERSLAFKLHAPETGELIDVEQLSQGTIDQVFLAARLGLVRLLTLDRRPPLILDDPLATFDSVRGERAVRTLKEFAGEHGLQVLYLTCSDRFDALADALVVLPGPSSERVLAQPPRSRPAAATAGSADPTAATAEKAGPTDIAAPTLRFEPDPRPNPDPVAPRRTPAASSRADRDIGIDDPFRLGRSDRNEAGD